MTTCNYELLWWDGDNEGTYRCTLPPDHLALHTDGLVWFNDDDVVECRCPRGCLIHQDLLPFAQSTQESAG